MSLQMTQLAWMAKCKHSAKLVLLALADCHNVTTGRCDPSTYHLMERTCLTHASIAVALKSLEDLGLISVLRRNGARSAYILNLTAQEVGQVEMAEPIQSFDRSENLTAQDFKQTTQESGHGPLKNLDHTTQESGPEPELTVIEPEGTVLPQPEPGSKKRTGGYSEQFEAFWKAYPRKEAKGKAWKAWQSHKPPLEKVLEALAWQVKTVQWTKESGQFIPLPSSYLNATRWEDEQKNRQGLFADSGWT